MTRRRLSVLFFAFAAVLVAGQAPATATTIKVDTFDDEIATDHDCALREAVEAARLNDKVSGCPKGTKKRDTIVLKAKDYQLGFVSTNENNNANGDLDVSGGGPVTVKGAGRTKTSIKQNANDRIFDLNLTSSNLTLQGLTLTNGDVTNFTIAEARGGAVRAINGKLTLNRVGVLSGDAFAGGGVYAANSARLTIKSSLLESNDAAHGGAINTINNAKATIKRTSFLANDAGSTVSDAQGGAIDNGGTGGMTIVDSSIQGSGATTTGAGTFTAGGGIRSSAPLTVRGSVVSGNTTSSGVDNQSEHGAGIYVGGGEAKIVNSTLFDNDAGVGGDNDGRGGGLYVNAGDAAARFTTFSGNSASNTGDSIARAGGTATVGTSIIDSDDDPCDGTVISSGFNVAEFDDPSCAFLDSDVAQADSIDFTGGLTDNGGPTETVAIAKTSLARNLIAKADCKSAKGTDQRGFARPKGTKCDAGAYEFGAKP